MSEVLYLSLENLLEVAKRTLGSFEVPDMGGLESAVARPRTTVFGADAYPTLDKKAAALAHSVARNHALIDGNERLALAGVIAFYGLNNRELTVTNDEAYDLIIEIATGELNDVTSIAARLAGATRPWRCRDEG